MTTQQAKTAFKEYESTVLEKTKTVDRDSLREAFINGYDRGLSDIRQKPLSRSTLLWYMAATAVSAGLWVLIYLFAKMIFNLF